jgi:hypothetical protein
MGSMSPVESEAVPNLKDFWVNAGALSRLKITGAHLFHQ